MLPAVDLRPDSVACLLVDEVDGSLTPVTHAALVNTVVDLAERYALASDDRVLAVGPLLDEVSLSSVLLPLLTGGAVVVTGDTEDAGPAEWIDLMDRERVTTWHASPSRTAVLVKHLLLGADPPGSLRLALLGGEPLSLTLAARLRRLVGPDLRVVNLGMCAAAGLWVSAHEPGDPESRRGHAAIGAPLANRQIYVMTDALTLCPVWVAGRIHLGGRGLPAEGAGTSGAGRPDGAAPYRTALVGRLLPEGTIEVVGDDATDLEVHGHPLHLHEVEGALATHPHVLAAAVVPAGDGTHAYVTTEPGADVSPPGLLDHLRRRMSPYLLPGEVEVLEALPLDARGRVDRHALTAAASRSASRATSPAAPVRTAAEGMIARACALAAAILDLPDIEPDANLLDYGATSVQLVRLAVRAEAELGLRVEVDELLADPSVHTLVGFEAARTGTDGDRSPAPADGVDLILDPVERQAFKDRQPGIRRDLGPGAVALARADDGVRLSRRRTHRTFRAAPVPAAAMGALLAATRRLSSRDLEAKYAYPSAGGLYPVQLYLTVVDGRVEQLSAGAHYYHPDEHALVPLDPSLVVDASAHAWINRDAFRSSGFTIYLVADLSAVAPMYGERARDYCLVEAGAICQLLMTTAPDLALGLCPVGEMDIAPLREALQLGPHHELLHALLGGMEEPVDDTSRAQADMLQRVGEVEL